MNATLTDTRRQAVTGLVPPQAGEAVIRETFPSVTAFPPVATLGRVAIRSYIAAPLGWFAMLPFYFLKILPVLSTRYCVTNRRVMVLKGWGQMAISHTVNNPKKPSKEVPLADIDDVRIVRDANSEFFRAGNLEIVSQGQVVLTLAGVPEPESFRQSILNASKAWVPGKIPGPFVPAKS
jgi:hypothetical protein